MIFKKPYAFLIKHFKLINLILTAFSFYVTYRLYNIISFFREYIKDDYSGNFYSGFSEQYISLYLYFIIILVIIGVLFIFWLLIYKKKPVKFYLSSILYNLILIVFLNVVKNLMASMEISVIEAETARIFRDLSILATVPQVYFILLFLIRGLGFNLKKFNFKEDIKELEIAEQDNEEIEVTFKGNYKLKRNIRRFGREFSVYLKENKFIFIVLFLIGILVIPFIIYNALPEKIDQKYNQGEKFNINNITYSIEDSIITNLDYKGNVIDKDFYYIVAKLYIENNSDSQEEVDINNFRVQIDDDYIYPMADKGANFIDYATSYTGTIIKSGTIQTYSLIYKINKRQINRDYKLKISNGAYLKDGKWVGKFNYVTLTPVLINEVIEENSISIGEVLSFTNSNLGNTTIKLFNPIITNKYVYNYEHCNPKGECNTYKDIINIDYKKNEKILLILNFEINLDENMSFYNQIKNVNAFIERFGKIKYNDYDEIKYASVKTIVTNKLKDKVIIETTNKIKNLDDAFLVFTIRNKEYSIKLK